MDIKVSIKRLGSASPTIQMSMGEYVEVIRGQAELLNIEKSEKPLTRNLKRSNPGIKDPGPYPTSVTFNPEIKGVHAKYTTEELGKQLNKAMKAVNMAYKEEL